MLKLFFQKCTRDWYSDQFQCRLALPINQPSLISNIRAKPEPCNLQSLEIDQRIESSDGQSCKGRGDGPTHTHTQKKNKKLSSSDEERKKKASTKPFRNAPRPRFVFLLISSSKKKKKTGGRQLYRSFLCLAQRQRVACTNGFCSCIFFFFFFLFRAQLYAANSWNTQVEKQKRQSGLSLALLLRLATSGISTHFQSTKCAAGICIELFDFLSS